MKKKTIKAIIVVCAIAQVLCLPISLAQRKPNQLVTVTFSEQPEATQLLDVRKVAARSLFQALNPAFQVAIKRDLQGYIEIKYVVNVVLLARTQMFDPHNVAVFISADGGPPQKVYTFPLSLEMDFGVPAGESMKELLKVIKVG